MALPVVVIVNFNAGDALQHCLAALSEQTITHRVVVIDNASTDGSSQAARARFPRGTFVPLRRNVGFCRAVNLAAARIDDPDSPLVLLNPDTVPHRDFVERLVQPLADDERVGAVAGTLVFSSAPEIVASAGVNVHRNGVAIDARLGERVDPARSPERVFGASGGAAAYRLSAFRAAGGFCEPFFLYLEDVDLAWRLQLLDWIAVSAPGAVALHDYSRSAGEGSPLKRRLLARNRIWVLARCLPHDIWLRDRSRIVAFDIAVAGFGLSGRDVAALHGRAEAIARLPARMLERGAIQRSARVSAETLANWVQPSIAPAELLRLRRLTARLARTTD